MITHYNYRIARIPCTVKLKEGFLIEEQACGIRFWTKKPYEGCWSDYIWVQAFGVEGNVRMPTLQPTLKEAERILDIIIAARKGEIVKEITTKPLDT
jgi:hypothetical protein